MIVVVAEKIRWRRANSRPPNSIADFLLRRARTRALLSISFSKPATSTVRPRSRAISCVRSSGNPCHRKVETRTRRKSLARRELRDLIFEERQMPLSRVLLNDSSSRLNRLSTIVRLFCANFGKDIAHRSREDVDQFVEKWLVKSQGAAVADGAAQNAAQDITAAFV